MRPTTFDSRRYLPALLFIAVSSRGTCHVFSFPCLRYVTLDFSHRGGLERIEMHLLPGELKSVKSGQLSAKIIK